MSTNRNLELFDAFFNGDIGRFSEIMDVHKVSTSYVVDSRGSIFEIVLSTPESSEFIRKCVDYDADLYLRNCRDQYPLKFAIDSQCIENIKTLESLLIDYNKSGANRQQHISEMHLKLKISSYFNLKDDQGRNSLMTLMEVLSDENFDNIFNIMKFLIFNGVNWHYACDGKTAMMILAERMHDLSSANQDEVIDFMQKCESKINKEVFIEFMKNSQGLVMRERGIKESLKIEMKSEELHKELALTYDFMKQLLMDGNINSFEIYFSTFVSSYKQELLNEYLSSFLEIAVLLSLNSIVDLLFNYSFDINIIPKDSKTELPSIFSAFRDSNVGIFQAFLLHPNVNLYYNKITILHHFLDQFNNSSASFRKTNIPKELTRNQKKCFNLLLKSEKCNRKFINAHDRDGMHVIYKTSKYKLDYVTIKLLDKGAYIGSAIKTMRMNLLEDFLDSRITADDKFYTGDKSCEIEIDYGFLMPEENARDDDVKISIEKSQKLMSNSASLTSYAEEMRPLATLAENVELNNFLMHPVISSFILLKWNMISFLIYANLVLILFFMLSFIPFNVFSQMAARDASHGTTFLYTLFYILSWMSLLSLIARESMQFIISFKSYLLSHSNWIDIVMIVSALLLLLFQNIMANHVTRVLRVIVILLAVAEYFNLLGLLPLLSVSIYTKMFRKVCATFMKSLAFYSVMILGFAFSFYALNGDAFAEDISDVIRDNRSIISEDVIPEVTVVNGTRSERYNNFYTVGHAIVKSFVMLMGEYEMSYVHIEGITYKVLIALFLFLVAIVLYNLLNALAVSDTQDIKKGAKLIDLHQRILTMHESEESVFKRQSKFGNWLKTVISLFPHTVKCGKIFIRYHNRIFVDEVDKMKVNNWMPEFMTFLKKDAKLNEEILQDIYRLLLKNREKTTSDELKRLKEINDRKFKNDIMKLHEMMRNVERHIAELKDEIRRNKN